MTIVMCTLKGQRDSLLVTCQQVSKTDRSQCLRNEKMQGHPVNYFGLSELFNKLLWQTFINGH